MSHADDGWGAPYDEQTYVDAYDQLELALLEPLDRVLEKADIEQFRPKFKNQQDPKTDKKQRYRKKKNGDDEWRDVLYGFGTSDESDFSDHEKRKHYFQPPLQVQRNSFVKNTLMQFKRNSQVEISRLAIMGCGEMSLEKGLCEYFGSFGTINVISVDIDPVSLSVGQQLLQKYLTQHGDILSSETGLPVLMRSYLGDILEPDHRFANVDAIVSLEVVEHIPLEDAKKFVNNVLGILLPRIFIFSTPNHEYNAVFGMKPGEFRHDDHKFEMNRNEFSCWLDELRVSFPHYQIEEPHYIGMTNGYEDLSGASQAAVCRLQDDLSSTLPQDITPYVTVGHVACRLGSRLVAYNLVRQALLEWLDKTEFHEAELKKDGYSPYWNFAISHILHHLHAPISFSATIDEKVAIKYIQGMTSHKVHLNCVNGVNGIAIPQNQKKADLIATIHRNELN
uniref:Small RNA 2'-O-methyltransferase n=1 Tax=Caenorhabditis tropicalis TaxID=1561998 RepID=A0A1I7V4T9_9PELO